MRINGADILKALTVGFLVLMAVAVLGVCGILLFPILLLLGFFVRLLLMTLLALFAVWFLGWITLILIESLRKR